MTTGLLSGLNIPLISDCKGTYIFETGKKKFCQIGI